MVTRINTVAFDGIKPILVDVQVHIAAGLSSFTIVGLADKAVAESKERIRASFSAYGLSLPAKRLTVNLSPADLPKEGNHYDVPIALAIMGEMGLIEREDLMEALVMGELALDGKIIAVTGILSAIMAAGQHQKQFFFPEANKKEAAWSGADMLYACTHLLDILHHFQGKKDITPVHHQTHENAQHSIRPMVDFQSIKGQKHAKRAMEIAAIGGHNILLSGPPGAGKSLLAKALQGILPPMSAQEILQTSMIHSLNGLLPEDGIISNRPFREPHHSTSTPAIIGGGQKAKPGEVSLAHNGILFLDEIPEFPRAVLEALRQPLETRTVTVSRVNAHVTYPASVQLVAAMNPCKCGYFGDINRQCNRAPKCAQDYQAKLSGPLLDRIDIFIRVDALPPHELASYPQGETSDDIQKRVEKARAFSQKRVHHIMQQEDTVIANNAHLSTQHIDTYIEMADDAYALLKKSAEKAYISARGWYRIIKVARTIADIALAPTITKAHMAEALNYRHR